MRLVLATLVSAITLASSAAYAGGSGAKAPDASAKPAKVVPKDPENVRGISPYEEKIARGKVLAGQKEWSSAAVAFQEAIDLKPDDARGYLLLAQAKRDADVIEIVEKGRSKKGTEPVEAKLMFVRAELLERKASLTPTTASGADFGERLKTVWDESLQAWGSYSAYVATHTRAPDYRVTADARRKAIADREAREQQYAVVRSKKDNK
jgi:hypothetical protein